LVSDNKKNTQLELDKYRIDIKKKLISMKPNLIVSLGAVSLISIFNVEKKIMNMRQKIFDYNKIDFLVTYHPKNLLDNLDLKKYAWEDFKLIRDKYINV
jgi:DNA polymerase